MTCIQRQSLHHRFKRRDIRAAGRAWWHDVDDQAVLLGVNRVRVWYALLPKAHHDGVSLPSPSCSRCLTGVPGVSCPLLVGTSFCVGCWSGRSTCRCTGRLASSRGSVVASSCSSGLASLCLVPPFPPAS